MGDDAEPEVVGQRMSGARPTTSPPPQGTVMKAPAHCIRGPSSSPASIVSRSAQSTKARNAPRSRTVVKPAWRVTRALRTESSASCAPVVVVAGTPAVWTSPTRWLWVSMSPGRTVRPDRSMTGVPSGRPSLGTEHSLDPRVAHEEDAVGHRLAALDVEETAGPDREGAAGVGEGGGLGHGVDPSRPGRPRQHSARTMRR